MRRKFAPRFDPKRFQVRIGETYIDGVYTHRSLVSLGASRMGMRAVRMLKIGEAYSPDPLEGFDRVTVTRLADAPFWNDPFFAIND